MLCCTGSRGCCILLHRPHAACPSPARLPPPAPQLSHSELVSQGALIASLEAQLAAARAELDTYQDVPPSVSGMQALLQRTQAELAAKQAQFDRMVLRADY